MTSVNPPIDGGYQYYAKSVDDLDSDYKADRKHARESQEEREAKLEKNYLEGLRKKDIDAQDTIDSVKKTSNDTLDQQQLKNKEDINQLKGQTYDRFGKFQNQQLDDMRQKLNTTQDELAFQEENTKKNIAKLEEQQQKKISEIQRSTDDASGEAIQKTKDSSLEASQQAAKTSIATNDENLRQLKARYGNATDSTIEQGNIDRRQVQKTIEESEKTFGRTLEANNDAVERRFDKLSSNFAQKETHNAELLERSRQQEVGKLSNQLADLVQAEKLYMKEKGQGKQEALKEFESSSRMNEQNIISSFNRDLQATKQRGNDAESAFTQMHSRTLKEKDLQNTKLTQGLQNEHHNLERDSQLNYTKNVQQLKDINLKERASSLTALDKQALTSQEHAENALKEQSIAFQRTLKDHQTSSNDHEKLLTKEIQERRSSGDVSLVSPAAEDKIRESVGKGYTKTLAAEQIRNRDQTESIQRNLQGKIFETKDKYESEMTRMQQQSELTRHMERSELLQHIQSTEIDKNEALRNQDRNQQRSSDYLNKVYGQSLEKQRKQYEDMIDTIKTDATLKQQTLRQDSDYGKKMAQRTFANQQNELIRNYEKRISDEKLRHEDLVSEIKAQADKAVIDKEKQMKQSVEEVARNSEQRIAQLEMQHTERERYVAQNFEDQLEKVKRSNALLSQKKS